MTAWMFITQSKVPIMAPKKNSAAASVKTFWTEASSGRQAHRATPQTISTLRQPWRVLTAPETGMASREPMPRHSRTRPS